MANVDRRSRAEGRRSRVVLRKSLLHAWDGDVAPVSGPEAVSLVHQLTRESWSLAGLAEHSYTRAETPVRFVPRPRR
jgi:hypothetical protein